MIESLSAQIMLCHEFLLTLLVFTSVILDRMQITDFDPNGTGQDNGNYFGLPFTPEDSELVLLSVPWDVTASYGGGARFGPDAVIGASVQLDLYDCLNPGGWKRGIGTIGIDYGIQDKSDFLRDEAVKVMKHLEHGGKTSDDYVKRKAEKINAASAELNEYVYRQAMEWFSRNKIIGLVGGDHSTPFGLIKALAEKEGDISVLHIDAHADLRPGYEGFEYSHASIMYNVLDKIPGVRQLTQVGVRDLCDMEAEFIRENSKIESFPDCQLAANSFNGTNWNDQCIAITDTLGDKVYVSFDIDGLSPENSPGTGTPVPGGLSFNQAVYLLNKVADSGRTICGFDICEVAPHADNEWDANVGARILYKLCNLTLKSIKK